MMFLHKALRSGVFILIAIGAMAAVSLTTTHRTALAAAQLAPSPTPPCDPTQTTCTFTPLPEPKTSKYNEAEVKKIDLTVYPLLPEIDNHILVWFEEGQKHGNNIHVFSKVGDCMTATASFLRPFSGGDYNLGDHASLDKVIKLIVGVPAHGPDAKAPDNLDSFANPGLAAYSGFDTATVLDPAFSDTTKGCKADESSLGCEYRLSKPGIAFIMFGTNDIKAIKPADYDLYLRKVVVQTINNGTIPVLSTFPTQPGLEDSSLLYNQITVQIAQEYDIPLINLWLALKPLPNQGVDPQNHTHMTSPGDGKVAYFTTDDLQSGFNVRNLLTLQTLEAILMKVDPALAQSGTATPASS
ncbi:MAG TPA: hypothetical protein VKQ72_00110 [Aggregatilineales bacterium]|nr:hypothetical protein [Aggregatilineales bacterium]